MNIQNRTKCYNYQDCFQAFGERQLMPITNTWENIIYCARTMKMLENSDPWNFLEMWDIYWETVKKNCYFWNVEKIKTDKGWGVNTRQKNLVELFCYISLLAPVQVSIFNRRYRSLDSTTTTKSSAIYYFHYYNVHLQRVCTVPLAPYPIPGKMEDDYCSYFLEQLY